MIRRLGEADAEAYVALRKASLVESPLSFAASPSDDFASSAEAFRERIRAQVGTGAGSAVFGAFDPALVGAVGIHRDRHDKAAHKARIWGMYVDPGHRRRGSAAALLDEALRYARTIPGIAWVQLSVSSSAPEARRLYERAGFECWGTEPDALRHDGEIVSEHHMALALASSLRSERLR